MVTATLTTCRANAKQYSPIWTAVIVVGLILFTIGLLWLIVVRARAAATKNGRSGTAAAPAIATERPDHARSAPIWPLLLGLAIIGVGILLGYTAGVGPYCDGAFTQQTSAAGADIASAMSGKLSNYSDKCRAAAGQQSVIYWGIIGFGGAVFVVGLVLKTVLGRRQSTGSRPSTIADDLEQLARLLERGVLTQDEFARQKEKLLSRG
ncbi:MULTISPECIES: SHOCT domain-containing protein [unclassified Pseudarthrobacter]|uniref:SHOCT domain-containing protein n=1 Tax=unclassified Pseudarthrobacter TaxID=2647000 RepID=UPI00307832E5